MLDFTSVASFGRFGFQSFGLNLDLLYLYVCMVVSWGRGGVEGGEGVFVLYLFGVDGFGGMGRYVI